jgi:uncharacterized membrane protein
MSKKSFIGGLLGVSLVLNGFLAGILMSGPKFQPPLFPMSPLERMEMAIPVLSPPQQEKMKTILAQHRHVFEEGTESMLKKVNHVQSILTAPTLDEKALSEALDQGPDRDLMRENMKKLLTETAKALPDEERVRFFKEIAPGPPPRMDHRPPTRP